MWLDGFFIWPSYTGIQKYIKQQCKTMKYIIYVFNGIKVNFLL